MRLPVNRFAQVALISLLSACGGSAVADSVPMIATNGPAADYPMVIGDPFVIDGVTHTPNDRLNYDAVGYAVVGSEGGSSVSVAHQTMPLPSYLEITALESGRTILARVERRGPMTNARLVELSPGAAAQLGLGSTSRAPVRVRRVNPPEAERAVLRTGGGAPARMDTPKSLLAVLTRKLDVQDGVRPAVIPATAASAPLATATVKPPVRPTRANPPAAAPVVRSTPVQAAVAAPPPVAGQLAVQVAAFSTRERAATVAQRIGAQVVQSGKVWRVRMGPYASQAEAQAALAKAKAGGYSDARIQRAD